MPARRFLLTVLFLCSMVRYTRTTGGAGFVLPMRPRAAWMERYTDIDSEDSDREPGGRKDLVLVDMGSARPDRSAWKLRSDWEEEESAEDDDKDKVKSVPENPRTGAREGRRLMEKGVHLAKEGRLDRACKILSQAIIAAPTLVEAHINLANVKLQLHAVDESIEGYREALKLRPGNFEAHYNLATALHSMAESARHTEGGWGSLAMSRWEDAEKEYLQALQASKSADAHYNLGNLYADVNRLDDAQEQYRLCLKLDSRFVDAIVNLGNVLLLKGSHESADAFFRKALSLDPSCSVAVSNRIRWLFARISAVLDDENARSGDTAALVQQALQLCEENLGVVEQDVAAQALIYGYLVGGGQMLKLPVAQKMLNTYERMGLDETIVKYFEVMREEASAMCKQVMQDGNSQCGGLTVALFTSIWRFSPWSELCHRGMLWRNLLSQDLESCAPEACIVHGDMSMDQLEHLLSIFEPEGGPWILSSSHGWDAFSRPGEGAIRVLRTLEPKRVGRGLQRGREYVLRSACTDPFALAGRKVVLESYVLMVGRNGDKNQECFVYNEGIGWLCTRPHDNITTDVAAHEVVADSMQDTDVLDIALASQVFAGLDGSWEGLLESVKSCIKAFLISATDSLEGRGGGAFPAHLLSARFEVGAKGGVKLVGISPMFEWEALSVARTCMQDEECVCAALKGSIGQAVHRMLNEAVCLAIAGSDSGCSDGWSAVSDTASVLLIKPLGT